MSAEISGIEDVSNSSHASVVEYPGEVLILSGPPGSGKTTTAKVLCRMTGSKKVHLHSDDFWHNIKHGALEPWMPEAHEQNAVVMRAISAAVGAYAEGGYFTVLDGIIGPWFLGDFTSLPAKVHYVVLRPTFEEALARCRQRGGSELSAEEPIAELHRQFADLGEYERNTLMIAGLTPDQTLSRILGALSSDDFVL